MMKKFKLSGFDLGMVIAAVVVTLLGGGAWYFLSDALTSAQKEVSDAKSDFDKYSTNPQFKVVVSPSNAKTLQANIDLIKAQLVPVIQTQFQSKDNKLSAIRQEDPVAWKHDLDDEVHRLNAAAKSHSVTVPPNFYFGFSRYLSQSPSDEQTAVLSKQLLAVEQISTILIGAQVKSIESIHRTYEEDPHASGSSGGGSAEGDRLNGYAVVAPGSVYTAYPFEVSFEANSENLRAVMSGIIQSPYVFVVRSLSIKNSNPSSPMLTDLDRMAGPPPSSVIDASPGEVAATVSTKGPQYLFGNSTLTVKARIDLIEWTASASALSGVAAPTSGASQAGPAKKGGI